ncbi:unnamed protein product [Closterium sp. Naga37s-1]|nr:unnamed protein product [Closterium sp. Naga37s-1]
MAHETRETNETFRPEPDVLRHENRETREAHEAHKSHEVHGAIREARWQVTAATGDEEACSADRSADVAGQRGRRADVARHGPAGNEEALCIGDVADLDFNRGEGVKVGEGHSEVQGGMSAVELDSVRLLASLPSLNSSDLAAALPALGFVNPLLNTEGVMESTQKSPAQAHVGPPHGTEGIAEAVSKLPAHTRGCFSEGLHQQQMQRQPSDPAVAASDSPAEAPDPAVAASDPDVVATDPPAQATEQVATEPAVAALDLNSPPLDPAVAAPEPSTAPLDPAVAALSDIQLPPGFTEGEAATEHFPPPSSDPPVDTLDPLVETQNPFAVSESTQKPPLFDPPVDTRDPFVETQNPFADTLSPLVDAVENVLGGRGEEGGGGEGGGGRGEEGESEEGAGKKGENEGGGVGTVGQGGRNDNGERKVAMGVGGDVTGQEGASALSSLQASLQATPSVSGWFSAEAGTKTGANAATAVSCSDARAAGDGGGEQGPSAGDTARGGRGQPSDTSSGQKPDQSEAGDDLSHGSQPGVKHGLSAVAGNAGVHAMLRPAGMVAPPYEHMRQPGMAVALADVLESREPSEEAGVTVDEQGLASLGFATSPLEGLGLEEGLGFKQVVGPKQDLGFKQELGFKQQLSLGQELGFKQGLAGAYGEAAGSAVGGSGGMSAGVPHARSAILPHASSLPGVQHAMSMAPELQQAIASSPTPAPPITAPPLAPHPPSLPPTPPPSPVPFLASVPTSHGSSIPPPAATAATQIALSAQALPSHTPALTPTTVPEMAPATVTLPPWSTFTVTPPAGYVEVHAGRAGCDNNEMLLKIGVEGTKEVVVRQSGGDTNEGFSVEVGAGEVKVGIKSGEDVTVVVGRGVGEGTTGRVEKGG